MTTGHIEQERRRRMEKRIIEVLGGIRPILQGDGGDVELVSVVDGVVKVKLQGACAGCPGAKMTMSEVIGKVLKEEVPGVKEVVGL